VALLTSQTHDAQALLVGTAGTLQLPLITIHRRNLLTSLSSIGDPERNSDREKRTNKSNDGNSKQRRRRNGKYNRQRQSSIDDNESKIKTTPTNISLKQFTTGPSRPLSDPNTTVDGLKKRVVQLETLVSLQTSELQKLRREMDDMAKQLDSMSEFVNQLQMFVREEEDLLPSQPTRSDTKQLPLLDDDFEIFGNAPTTIKDAADSAGQSILSAILAGKQRMLVDVRDAELTRDPSLLVEFIELSILPVAAGLRGLSDAYNNRVKIVFPTVEELLRYRKSMALASPEVVALSTLGFDPVEEKDHLIVIVAPSPDDVGGCALMNTLLERSSENEEKLIYSRPVVIINHHMMPLDTGRIGKLTVVYHLRLLSVQYMTGDIAPEYVSEKEGEKEEERGGDLALEAAMTHARESGVHQVCF
jgi:archaellum component FlaC